MVFATDGDIAHPLFLVMTAIMTTSIAKLLGDLTNVNWTDSRHHRWALAFKFRQRNITMGFSLTADLGQAALLGIISHLGNSPQSRICLFVNTVEDGRKWSRKLGELIAVADLNVFVPEINGEIDKMKSLPLLACSLMQ